uniref:Aconitate hydratase, mitochondrial n=1 Tax=Bionectria ochroleuca TaxID=29856 RepID=A0A8H7N0M7_BIOOC
MAIIQFMSAGLSSTAAPTSVHCDHLIVGKKGQDIDLPNALNVHKEVFDFLSSACKRFNIGFWKAGAGIIHQSILENYAFPGGLMIGADSHTPNAGGLGMMAIGVGGADAVDVMAGLPFELKAPGVIGVRLTGRLLDWTAPKDVINQLVSILTVKGGTGNIIEFFGPGTQSLSATGMCTITNMGAETGATTSIFPYSDAMNSYLKATHRHEIAAAADFAANELKADEGAEYDQVIEIDLSTLEPHINGPFTPDLSTPISKFGNVSTQESWPPKLTAGFIGSCTNSSFQDMTRAADLAKQALTAGLKPKMPLFVSPGSEQTRETLRASGALAVFEELGSTILPNACGPCCGSFDREGMEKGTRNSVITTYNRNFTGRLDGNPATYNFLSSPEMVMAKIFSDNLGFNPIKDAIKKDDGSEFRFSPPKGEPLPTGGYANTDYVFTKPPSNSSERDNIQVQIPESSDRLQRLSPFPPGRKDDIENCVILIKTKGKCTTDHITPAGPWFRFRGHLDNISNNTLIGAVNAENDQTNSVTNWITGEEGDTPGTARAYKNLGQPWVVIGDYNYGEGSSREHAALQPRYLGCLAIIARSFARIHETNLKKQGVLALTFANEEDYDRIHSSDRISILGISEIAPGKSLTLQCTPTVGNRLPWTAKVNHSMTSEQVEYFKAGSALNLMANRKSESDAAASLL